MKALGSHEIVTFFLSIAFLLGVTRGLGELFLKYRQPVIVGEILGGILLGPTVLGYVAPEFSARLLPNTGNAPVVLEGFMVLSVAFLLLMAGLDVDLSLVWRQGRTILLASSMGFILPWVIGFSAAIVAPALLGQPDDGGHSIVFALFFGTALTISSLPVIAKALMDLNLFKSKAGMVIVTSAMIDDLAGWIVFSVVLAIGGTMSSSRPNIWLTVVMTVGFAMLMLTVGRWAIDRALKWRQRHLAGPGGGLGMVLVLTCICAAATEAIGVHAIFGAFLLGVAVGDSKHLGQQTRESIKIFVLCFFAPIYLASIGLRANFTAHFDLPLIMAVLLLGCAGKILGGACGAYWGGMTKREMFAVGFGMSATGIMQIVVGTVAFQHGLIGEKMLVAFVIMAVVTSMLSGPAIEWSLGRRRPATQPKAVGEEIV